MDELKDKLTIVIPSKNEQENIFYCISYISLQYEISGVRVIIADNSDDEKSINWLNTTVKSIKNLDIQIIKGGLPAQGRLYGSRLVKTPYVLFLDADIMLKNHDIIYSTFLCNKGLTTIPFVTDIKYDYAYRLFDFVQKLMLKTGIPFALGGYQLWNMETYWKTGGYNEDELFAEDFSISKKVNPKDFHVYKCYGVYTPARRFEKKGIVYMFLVMIKSYWNRNNPEFFKKAHGYWD